MDLREELRMSRPPAEGEDVILAVLLTREFLGRFLENRVFAEFQLSDPQYNLLRILRGGPEAGYLVQDIRRRMLYRFADVSRLAIRLEAQGLVRRREDPGDRRGVRVSITAEGRALTERVGAVEAQAVQEVARIFDAGERAALLGLLDRLRDALRSEADRG